MKQITKHVSKLGILFTIGMVLAGCEGIGNFMGGDEDSSIDRGGGGATAGEKNPISLPSNFLPGGQDQQGMFVPEMNMVTVQSNPKMIIGSGKDGVFLENRYVTFSPYQISDTEITRGLYYFVMSTDLTWLTDDEGVVSPELKADLAKLKYSNDIALPNKIYKVETFYLPDGSIGRNIQGDYWVPEAYVVAHLPSTTYTYFDDPKMIQMWDDKDYGLQEYFFGTERDEEGNLVNPSKPMGYLQWHDAVMFCNKLSLLTGKKPAYVLTGYGMDGNTPTVQKSRNPDIWRRGANNTSTGHYEEWPYSEGLSQILFYQYDADHKVTRWTWPRGTAERDSWWSRLPQKAVGLKNALAPNTTGARKAGITIDLSADGYRLPTEVEWELAARGGNQRDSINWEYAYAGGDDPALVGSFLNPDNTGPQPVRSKLPNSLGLYDMSGNMAEWIHEEFYELDYTGTAPQFDQNKFNRSPSGGTLVAGTSVTRGGSYRDEATRSNGDETQYLHKLTERVSYPSSGWSAIWQYDRTRDQDYEVPYSNLGMRIVCNVK